MDVILFMFFFTRGGSFSPVFHSTPIPCGIDATFAVPVACGLDRPTTIACGRDLPAPIPCGLDAI